MAKKVAVPSLVGTTQDAAETALTDAGLSVVKRYVAGDPDGTVYSQLLEAGKVAKGDVATIDILRAPTAPVLVDLSGVTKSIGELNKAVRPAQGVRCRAQDIRWRAQNVRGRTQHVRWRAQDVCGDEGRGRHLGQEHPGAARRGRQGGDGCGPSCRDTGAGPVQGVAGQRRSAHAPALVFRKAGRG